MKRLLATVSFALLLTPLAYTQQQMMGEYLDVFRVKVRPEKRADFDAINRKVADANRKGKGDFWIASQSEYGEINTVQFTSTRESYAGIESGMNAFMNAIKEAYGPGGLPKMMADFNGTILSGRAEIRRRRWDLSPNPPADPDAYSNMLGHARWIRTIEIRGRNGREEAIEERLKEAKPAIEKGSKWSFFVSETTVGAPGPLYYISTLQPTLAAFDSAPKLPELMGKDEFTTWMKGMSEDTISVETVVMRILPEFSNPPEAVAKVDPDFWRPKRAVAGQLTPAKGALTAKAGQ